MAWLVGFGWGGVDWLIGGGRGNAVCGEACAPGGRKSGEPIERRGPAKIGQVGVYFEGDFDG